MKKKNTVIIVITSIAILLVISLLIIFKPTKTNLKNINNKAAITHLKTVSSPDIPQFAIAFAGKYTGAFTHEDIDYKNLTVYEFDGTVYNGWDLKTNHYLGVKVSEAFKALDITEYKTARVVANGGINMIYEPKDITDNAFFVFSRDGKKFDERLRDSISILIFDKDYEYSIENVEYISFDTEGVIVNEN